MSITMNSILLLIVGFSFIGVGVYMYLKRNDDVISLVSAIIGIILITIVIISETVRWTFS